MAAKLIKQLQLVTVDKMGLLADIGSAISSAGVNIEAICAYSMEGKAIFMLVSSDNTKTKEAVKPLGMQVEEEDVVMVSLENTVGSAKEMGDKLKAAGINISYLYGTAATAASPANLVFKSDNNQKAVEVLS